MTLDQKLEQMKGILETIADKAAQAANPNSYHSLAYREINQSPIEFSRQTLIRYYYSRFHSAKDSYQHEASR